MTQRIRNIGQGPQMVPLHPWAIHVDLDGNITAVRRLDELNGPRWVATGELLEHEVQLIPPIPDDPFYTLIVEAMSEPAARATIIQVMAQLEGGDRAA